MLGAAVSGSLLRGRNAAGLSSIHPAAADDDRLQRARAVIRHKPRQKKHTQRILIKEI